MTRVDDDRSRLDRPPSRSGVASAVTSAVVVAGCLWFYDYWHARASPWLVIRWDDLPQSLLALVSTIVPFAVLAVALGAWGIDRRHRVLGSAGAVAVGLVDWALLEGLQHWASSTDDIDRLVSTYEWALVLTVPTGLALAWGLARRSGKVWAVGLLVAPVLSAARLALHQRWSPYADWQLEHASFWARELGYLSPAILAGLTCWWLEAAAPPTGSGRYLADPEKEAAR